ncbi:MAG: hypothetical protein R3C11_16475 [Planctomycetaceae bacterium]
MTAWALPPASRPASKTETKQVQNQQSQEQKVNNSRLQTVEKKSGYALRQAQSTTSRPQTAPQTARVMNHPPLRKATVPPQLEQVPVQRATAQTHPPLKKSNSPFGVMKDSL